MCQQRMSLRPAAVPHIAPIHTKMCFRGGKGATTCRRTGALCRQQCCHSRMTSSAQAVAGLLRTGTSSSACNPATTADFVFWLTVFVADEVSRALDIETLQSITAGNVLQLPACYDLYVASSALPIRYQHFGLRISCGPLLPSTFGNYKRLSCYIQMSTPCKLEISKKEGIATACRKLEEA